MLGSGRALRHHAAGNRVIEHAAISRPAIGTRSFGLAEEKSLGCAICEGNERATSRLVCPRDGLSHDRGKKRRIDRAQFFYRRAAAAGRQATGSGRVSKSCGRRNTGDGERSVVSRNSDS